MIDLKNVQGLIVRGYRYPCSRHLLFRFAAAQAGRDFLRNVMSLVTWMTRWIDSKPSSLLNLGIAYGGLAALGLPQDILKAFPDEFRALPDPIPMGDYGRSAPSHWWHQRCKTEDIHCIVHVFALDAAALDDRTNEVRALARQSGHLELLPTVDGKALEGQALGEGKVHFGYRDGISQPQVDWGDGNGSVSFKHFLLGYSDTNIGSQPEDSPAREIFRDSSYAVLRWMYQDVACFNRFLNDNGPRMFPALSAGDARELLAAKLLGRWRDGTPLALSPHGPDPDRQLANDFDYAADPLGERCPFSAHVRVTNPRNQELNPVVLGGVPRLIRRGAPFGPELASDVDDGQERGLIGLFICASILRQFYEQTRWMKRTDFSPVFANIRTQDPFGNRAVPDASPDFSIPLGAGKSATCTLLDFVRTLGTAFFLLPSRSALAYLSQAAS